MSKFLSTAVLAAILAPGIAISGTIKTTLKSAMAKELVKVSALKAEGSYNEKGLSLKIDNKSKETLEISVDPALIFQPEDTAYQDLMIAGNERTTIAPGASRQLMLQSYCAKSYARGPLKGLVFRYQKQGDSNMIKVMDYVRKNGINNESAQHAVWVLTNKHDLSSVYIRGQDEASRKLVAYMAGLLHQELPPYFRQYNINTTPGQPVFVKKTLKIFALFQWQLDQPKNLTLAVYDSSGRQVDKMFENKAFKKGGYELNATFESAAVTAGDYYIRLLADGTMLKEKKVTVD